MPIGTSSHIASDRLVSVRARVCSSNDASDATASSRAFGESTLRGADASQYKEIALPGAPPRPGCCGTSGEREGCCWL